MKIEVRDITEKNVDEIPKPCRNCVYWENPENFERISPEQAFEYKKSWFIENLKNFGVCGKILYVDGVPVAYAQFAPSSLLPQVKNYNCSSLGKPEDRIIFLSCLFVCRPEYRNKGLGSKLLTDIISTLKLRGFKGIETFAREDSPNNPSGPVHFYLKHGFQIKEKLDQNFALMHLRI